MKIRAAVSVLLVGILGIFPTSSVALERTKRWENGDMSNMFRGTAGVDYPDYQSVPNTAFRCEQQEYEGGLYADVETRCQVYHVCHDGRKDSFICGKGTVFNQQILACDYWYSADCESSPNFYYLNSQIGNGAPNKCNCSGSDHTGHNNGYENSMKTSSDYGSYNQNCNSLQNIHQTQWLFPTGQYKK